MMCNEDATNLILLEIENKKRALETCDLIIPVIKKFNGKVLNKRLETALKNVCSNLWIESYCGFFIINFSCFDNRMCYSSKIDEYGRRNCLYSNLDVIRLNTCLHVYNRNKEDISVTDTNNRIKANILIESLECGKKQLEDEIKKNNDALNKVDEWQSRMKKIIKDMQELRSEIPYAFQEYFKDLNHHID